MSERYTGIIPVRQRGVVTLPAELRKRLRLDSDGAQLEVTERDDGVIELRPTVAVPADQAWFWTDRWQQMEREADHDVDTGQVLDAEDLEGLINILDTGQ